MPAFEFRYGDPVPEIWGAMHFPGPDDATNAKRRAFVADIRAGYFPDFFGETQSNTVFEVLKDSRPSRPSRAEFTDRNFKGQMAGQMLLAVSAIAAHDASSASWAAAIRIVTANADIGERTLNTAKKQFTPVIHLWAAHLLNGGNVRAPVEYEKVLADAMWFHNWATRFILRNDSGDLRAKADPLISPNADMWLPPKGWKPPADHRFYPVEMPSDQRRLITPEG